MSLRVQCYNHDKCLHADQLCMSCANNSYAPDPWIDHFEPKPQIDFPPPGGEKDTWPLVQVKNWVADQKGLDSTSFRARVVKDSGKAVLLRLRDGKEIWVPWSAVTSMEKS